MASEQMKSRYLVHLIDRIGKKKDMPWEKSKF